MKKIIFPACLILIVFCCASCQKTSKDDSAGAIKPVEAFYNAIVTQDRDRVSTVVCADWEKTALREVDAFMGVKSELTDFSCSLLSSEGENAVVTCKGAIAASYGAEVTNFSLEGREHKVIKEDGEWRFCGY